MSALNLNFITDLVEHIMQGDPQTRNSDSYLYLKVLQHKADNSGIFLDGMTVPFFLQNMSAFGFPPFESVRRARQKVQLRNPDLAPCEKIAAYRAENEREFRSYAVAGGDGHA